MNWMLIVTIGWQAAKITWKSILRFRPASKEVVRLARVVKEKLSDGKLTFNEIVDIIDQADNIVDAIVGIKEEKTT